MLSWLIEPLSFEFMRQAIVTATLLGILCSVVGSYLIVQRMALLGDVIAHAVLPGLAISFFLGIDIFIGAFISGTLSTLVIGWIQSQSRVKVDVAMALVFSGSLALGIMLITLLKSKLDLHSFLFGDILGVTSTDVERTLFITILVLLLVKLFYKELLFYTFNPLGAKAMGLPVNIIHFGLISAITLTIIASMQAVGVVLVVSLLVSPGITAYLLVKELHQMMGLGAIIGVFSSVSGMYISYYLNVPSGAAIVLFASGLFIVALLFSPSQGILTRPEMAGRSAKIVRFKQHLRDTSDTDGRVVDLTALCGNGNLRANVKVNTEQNIVVNSLSYNGNLLVGQVTNHTDQTVRSVTVIYSVLDSQGHEIDVGLLDTKSASPIAPGASISLQQVSEHPGATVKVTSVDWQYGSPVD